MEKELENKLDKFIGISYNHSSIYDYGDGSGYGSGNGDGIGFDYGDGSGYGFGDGDGIGFDSGDGDGRGFIGFDGDGRGCDYGWSYLDGYAYDDWKDSYYGICKSIGAGYGYDITFFNGKKVYQIDNIPTIIESVHDNYAKGYILHSDLTLEPCYVAKLDNCFAHGKTLREALEDVTEKVMQGKSVEERIEEFLEEFKDNDKRVPAKELYKWHGFLTGSCRFGRNAFLRDHNIDIDNDEFTVKEFIDLAKNEYGSEVIKKLEKKI